ncbi:hypothetical protein E4U43_005807 [Claviceps pusilla]|uniref:Heparan-alpha-glucosaminide N-acetyltransferase catalytic domain-containing protein n=1 Tax=Claviceps pusilla TaxID=123648 RepID=A0A9P7SW41_9HYPO|nr:hypothetical protein E4U43_005807 [Claviceps pusilla]
MSRLENDSHASNSAFPTPTATERTRQIEEMEQTGQTGEAGQNQQNQQTEPSQQTQHTDPSQQTQHTEPSPRRQDNGYLYDSFPVGHVARVRHQGPSGRPQIAPTALSAGGKSGGARVLAPDLTRGLLMMIMTLDHASLSLHIWQHGTGRDSEQDGRVITRWNYTTAYIVRTLTHLCAPGFTFLLGMGVVYLGRSRTKLGWGSARLARYFAVRCVVLTVVTAVLGLIVTGGKVYFMNAVLFALAVDYLLAGLLWLAMDKTEALLTRILARTSTRKSWLVGSSNQAAAGEDADDESIMQPLLRERREADTSSEAYISSWSIHNAVLLVFGAIAIFWNIWLSDDGGECKSSLSAASTSAASAAVTVTSPTNPFLRIWFWVMMQPGSRIMSGFPPMAWLSFALFGMLYGRIMTARSWTRQAAVLAHLFAAMVFAIVFVLTRVLEFGNLSTGCLRTPDQDAHPTRNPYLASPASFFYIVKYPPDVAFFAFTMAGTLLLLALFTAIPPRIAKRMSMLLDFGTSALFFYVAHMLLLFPLGAVVVMLFGHDTGVPDPMNPGQSRGVDNLFGYFAFWALVILLMRPLCAWYSRFKSTKGADSIWRFF